MMIRRDFLRSTAAAALTGWGGQAIAVPATAPPLVIVVGPGTRLQEISIRELRLIYMLTPAVDPAGLKLVPLNQPPGTPDRILFDRVVLGMTAEQVQQHWLDQLIRGRGRPPRHFEPPQLVKVVARFPGAIGYVRADRIDGSVRILRLNGKTAGSIDYPLHGQSPRQIITV